MSIEAMKQALENELSSSDFIDKAPKSWDKTERTEWARLQAMYHNIRVFKKAMRQAIAEAEKQEHGSPEDMYVEMHKHLNCPHCGGSGHIDDVTEKQEPVASAWMHKGEMVNAFPWPPNDPRGCDEDKYWKGKGYTAEPLYTHPQPKREWVGLTDEEFISMIDSRGIRIDPVLAFEIKEIVETAKSIKE